MTVMFAWCLWCVTSDYDRDMSLVTVMWKVRVESELTTLRLWPLMTLWRVCVWCAEGTCREWADDATSVAVDDAVTCVCDVLKVESELTTLRLWPLMTLWRVCVCDVLKVRVESELTTLRLWPLMTLLSRTVDELYRLDCDGVLLSDLESTGRVSAVLYTCHIISIRSQHNFINKNKLLWWALAPRLICDTLGEHWHPGWVVAAQVNCGRVGEMLLLVYCFVSQAKFHSYTTYRSSHNSS